MAWVLPKHLDINLLLNRTWFTPLEDRPAGGRLDSRASHRRHRHRGLPGRRREFRTDAGARRAFGEDLERAKACGDWFRRVRPYLDGAQPYADVAIVLGTPGQDGPGLPSDNLLWKRSQVKRQGAWAAVALGNALAHRRGL